MDFIEAKVSIRQNGYTSPKLEKRRMLGKGGNGVFAKEHIVANELLAVFGGQILHSDELRCISEDAIHYSIQIEEELYLLSLRADETSDFINHSCDPNAGLDGQVVLRAMRDIHVGEEICFDYAMCDGSSYDEFQCGCGSILCRGYISGNDWQRSDLQKRYQGWFSQYLQRRIKQLTHPTHSSRELSTSVQILDRQLALL